MIKRLKFSEKTVPVALLVACLLGFGIQIAWLGFYWDDWPGAWFLHRMGPLGFTQVFAEDRPALGWLFILTTTLIGKSPLGWQIFGLATRWLCSLAFWWMLRKLWPEQLKPVTWAAMLFAVYPGFKQQHIALTYSHDWLIMAGFFLSFIVMLSAISAIPGKPIAQTDQTVAANKKNRLLWLMLTAAWVLAAYCMFADEYYFGLEVLRPVFLWMILKNQEPNQARRLKRTVLYEIPFLVIGALFLIWRLLIHVSPRGSVQVFERLSHNPWSGIVELLRTILADVLQTSFGAWSEVVDFSRLLSLGTIPSLTYLIALVAGISLALIFLLKYHPSSIGHSGEDPAQTAIPVARATGWIGKLAQSSAWRWALQALFLGALALFSGGIPFWVTYQPIELAFPWDRFTLPMMLGASLLMAGLLELFIPYHKPKMVILAVAIGLAIGLHVYNSNLYRREWASQKELFWQLSWRAPAIQPGTLILTADLPFTYFSDNSLTAPLNWIYDPEANRADMQYLLYAVEARLGNRLPDLKAGIAIEHPYRGLVFRGSTSQAVVIYFNPPGCLKVIEPAKDARLPQKGDYLDDLIPLSKTDLIRDSPGKPALPPVFGRPPDPNWCFYYEKADLARQLGDWQAVINWAELALTDKPQLYEVNAPEYIPYIEGYARLGKWEQAEALTLEAYQLSPRMQRMLCSLWSHILQNTEADEAQRNSIASLTSKVKCALPGTLGTPEP